MTQQSHYWAYTQKKKNKKQKQKPTNSKRYMHFKGHRSTSYNSQDMEATQVSINRGIDKEDVLYRYIQWSITQPLKKNEIMPFAATWMDLEIIIVSEVSDTEKDKYMISLICGI